MGKRDARVCSFGGRETGKVELRELGKDKEEEDRTRSSERKDLITNNFILFWIIF